VTSLPREEKHAVRTDDGVDLELTRVRGGPKGPVMLVHGAGVWSGTFTIRSTPTNLVKFLTGHGYDTWLLDWRGSIKLPLRHFTLDEASRHDFPAAVRRILETTGAESLQAVAHCMGGNVLAQSLALGLLPELRSACLSTMALHFEAPVYTDLKVGIHLAEAFASAGIGYMSARESPDEPLFHRFWHRFVNLYHLECDSDVCHRVSFMYGTAYRHENLNRETHDSLGEHFGALNMTTLIHISQNVRRGSASMYDHGAEKNLAVYGTEDPPSYLRPAGLRIPISLVTGRKNTLWEAASIRNSFDWLCRHNDPSLYECHILEDYGHQDLYWGVDAARDVYPLWLAHLESFPR
jgi:pimeloyl-ACP methyl ester carboxylesterase